jgi:hypothetical protein
MKSRIPRLLTAAVLVVLCATAAWAQNVAGDWELTIAAPQGENVVSLSLALDGAKATGNLSSQLGTVPVEGTATGNTVAVVAKIDAGGMTLELGFNGTVAGDAMTGNVKMGDFGEFPFTGKRVAKSAAAARPPAAAAAAAPTTTGGMLNAGGKWDVTLSIAGMGELPANASLTQDGANLTGTLTSMAGEVPVSGTVTGTSLRLVFKADSPQGRIEVVMTGEATPDGLKGKATLAGVGEADWTAKRSAQQ